MPDSRKHRGRQSRDNIIFSDEKIPVLRKAVHDFYWLLSRKYPHESSLTLVGNRYKLQKRQRIAVKRTGCSELDILKRMKTQWHSSDMKNKHVLLDGFNIIITLEAALSGGYIFIGIDGCFRDLSSVHGSYRKVEETERAIQLIFNNLKILGVNKTTWYLDAPVSNSGRLKKTIEDIFQNEKLNQELEVLVVKNPDRSLISQDDCVVSSDSVILNDAEAWFNLTKMIIENDIPNARLIDLNPDR
jgi:hypothetical protein